MKANIEKEFVRAGRRRQALFEDDVIRLIPREYAHRISRLDGACSMVFDIIDIEKNKVSGEIAQNR